MPDEAFALQARGISKHYGATHALKSVDFNLKTGEIHALLGENGAGKSTLVKILAGTEPFDAGEIMIGGTAAPHFSAAAAAARGLFVVHQELALVDELSVAENICLGRPPLLFSVGGLGFINRSAMHGKAAASLRIMDTDLDTSAKVRTLDQAERQVVEICRALAQDMSILLLDEPTSSLAPDDRERLYRRMRSIAATGVAILLITHNLDEALAVSDRVTVLRDGTRVDTILSRAAQTGELIEMMTGLSSGDVYPKRVKAQASNMKLEIRDLHSPPRLNGVSLELREGEIFGLAGLVGSGRTELMKCLFGLLPRTGGTICLEGAPVHIGDPVQAVRAGLFMISEDRQGEGIVPTASVLTNMALSNVNSRGIEDGTVAAGILRLSQIRHLCGRVATNLQVKVRSLDDSILSLSGGNQQKAILGRCILNRPRVILADEPTRGVSIGSKVQIYKAIRELAAEGASVLIASSEFDELVGLCNRIGIIDRGRIVEIIDNVDLASDRLLNLVLSATAGHRSRYQGFPSAAARTDEDTLPP